jgi:hypothetical protein
MYSGYVPTAAQSKFHASKRRIKIASGSVRSGKTLACAREFVRLIMRDISTGKRQPESYRGRDFSRVVLPTLRYWVLSRTYDLLKQAMGYVHSLIPPESVELWLQNERELWLRHPDGGFVLIAFKSGEDHANLVGVALDGVFLDEAARVDRAIWERAIFSRLAQTGGFALLASAPHGGRGNWTYELVCRARDGDPDIEAFEFFAKDNPAVPPEQIDAARRFLPTRIYKQDWEGSWENDSALVFDEWDIARHVVTEEQLRREYGIQSTDTLSKRTFYGADWGWHPDPTAMVAIIDTGREFLAVEEVVGTKMPFIDPSNQDATIVGHAWRLRRRWGSGRWGCDHQFGYADQLRDHGLEAGHANKDIVMGVRVLSTLLHGDGTRPRLRILNTCKRLVREMGALSWKLDKDGNPLEGELDPKVKNDASDALRYALVGLRSEIFADDGIPRRPVTVSLPGVGTWTEYVRH